jgi:hypothetical protein
VFAVYPAKRRADVDWDKDGPYRSTMPRVHAHPWHRIRRIRPNVEVLPRHEAKRVVQEAGRMLSEALRSYQMFWPKM